MQGIGDFCAGRFVPNCVPGQQDVALEDVDQVIEGLEALSVVPKWLSAVEETDKKISVFHERLAERRTQKKDEINAYFMDDAHVSCICGQVSTQNSNFVKEIVENPHFLGNLRAIDVLFLLEHQQAKTAVLYIQSEWVRTDLRNSCSPQRLEAKLLFSFADGRGGVEHCKLVPGYGIKEACDKHSARFLEVDESIKAIGAFKGFSAYSLLSMQTVTFKDPVKRCYRVATSITKDELHAFLSAEDKRAQLTTDRYSNIFPYACNCVGTGIEGQDINGSYVRAGGRRFIACQGPGSKTVEAFWQAVAFHGTETVIALGPSTEGQGEKFHDKYFMFDEPLILSDGTCIKKIEEDTALDWTFVPENGEQEIEHCIISRTFECVSPSWGKHVVRHYHCPTWQDMAGGDPRILTELVNYINMSGGEAPVIVHCSAGVGRTGTLLTAYELHTCINPVAPLASLIKLRHERHGLIQTPEQMEMLLRFITSK